MSSFPSPTASNSPCEPTFSSFGERELTEASVRATTDNSSQSEAFSSRLYCGVDDLKSMSEAAGWTINYDQIQAGQLVAYMNSRRLSDISLTDEGYNRRLEVCGTAPAGHLTFVVPCGATRLWAVGQTVSAGQAYVLPSDGETLALTGDDNRVLCMHVPSQLFEDTVSALRAGCPDIPNHGLIPQFSDGVYQHFRQLIHTGIYAPRTGTWQSEQSMQLAEFAVTSLAFATDRAKATPINLTAAVATKTISRARSYVEAHLDEPLSMSKICSYTAVSLSKLERLFRRELGITPSRYILARRLQATRRQLQLSSPEHSNIAAIANNFGFHHLGRFSGAYRAQFGELPSDTLREHR